MKKTFILLTAVFLAGCLQPAAFAQGTAFTYQGRLNVSGAPANGSYDFQLILYDASTGGNEQGAILTRAATSVSNGLFTITLDFGNEFPGAARWLDIGVRTNGGGTFSELVPRQQLAPVPYAVTAANVTGAIPLAQLPSAVLTNGAGGVNLTGTFGGSGAGLTNVALLAGGNTFSGSQTITAGSLYLDNNQEIFAKNTLGVYEGFLWPRWSDNVTYLNFGGGGFHIRNNLNATTMFMQPGGNVGIGTSSPGFPLSFASTLGDKIALWGASGNSFGFGIQGSQLQIHADVTNSDIVFGNGSSANLVETMRIKGTGNVGIGTASPGQKLQVGDGSVHGSQGMIRLGSFTSDPSGSAGRSWDIGVPQTGNNATGIGYSFVINDDGLGSVPQFMVQYGSGNVGIGTTNPAAKLDVSGNANFSGGINCSGGITSSGVISASGGISSGGGSFQVTTADPGNQKFGLNTSYGNVTMNVRQSPTLPVVFRAENSAGTPLFEVEASGTVEVNEISGDTYGLQVNGTPADTVSIFWTIPSDARLKQDVRPFEAGLGELMQLHTVRYRYQEGIKRGLSSRQEHAGVLAQEVQEVFPDAVQKDPDGYLALQPDPIFWASIHAIQQLNQKVEEKDAKISELEKRLNLLEQSVQALGEKK